MSVFFTESLNKSNKDLCDETGMIDLMKGDFTQTIMNRSYGKRNLRRHI